MWEPISLEELNSEIGIAKSFLKDELLAFWELIKIEPEKWLEPEYGNESGGFWVVGLFGNKAIWYNDIEEGFNVSTYNNYGTLDEYGAEQDNLNWTLGKIFKVK